MARFAALIGGALLAAGLLVRAAPSSAQVGGQSGIDGWRITRGDQAMVCIALGPSDGSATLSLVAEGPQFLLMLAAPDFPQDKNSYSVTLAFDDKKPVYAVALGDNGLMSINVGRGEAARILTASSKVSVGVTGRIHNFSLRNVKAALDAVARCAGQPALSEESDEPPLPIAGAGDWKLEVTLPGAPGRACAARIAGDQVDTMIILNRDNDLLLIGGHGDWATWGGPVSLRLSIDGEPPIPIAAKTAINLIMTLVKDPVMVQRLRSARTLDWTIPTGHVRGDVAGLGLALDAIKACKAKVG